MSLGSSSTQSGVSCLECIHGAMLVTSSVQKRREVAGVVSSKSLALLPLTVLQDRRLVARNGYGGRTGVRITAQQGKPTL